MEQTGQAVRVEIASDIVSARKLSAYLVPQNASVPSANSGRDGNGTAKKPAEKIMSKRKPNDKPELGFFWVVVQERKNGEKKFLRKKFYGLNFLLAFTTERKLDDFLQNYRRCREKYPENIVRPPRMISLSYVLGGVYASFGSWHRIAVDPEYNPPKDEGKKVGTIGVDEIIDIFDLNNLAFPPSTPGEAIINPNYKSPPWRTSATEPEKGSSGRNGNAKPQAENGESVTATDVYSRDPEVKRLARREEVSKRAATGG